MYMIRLRNCAFFAHHGALAPEEELGQRFFVDVDFAVDAPEALVSDDVTKTVHYGEVFKLMQKIITGRRFDLIEALAHAIGTQLLETFPQIVRVEITVRKPSAPIKGILDSVSVTVAVP